jgi:hypothetical protein
MKPWEQKANRIIAELSRRSWLQANLLKNDRLRKRHAPYSVPPLAEALMECLGSGDEERAKALFHRHHYLKSVGALE